MKKIKQVVENMKLEVLMRVTAVTTATTTLMWEASNALCAGNVGNNTKNASALSDTQVNNILNKATVWGQGILLGILCIALLILVAFPFLSGGEEGAQKAKKNAKHILIGFAIGELALNIGLTFYNFIKLS